MTSASDVVYVQGKPMDRLSAERFKSQNMMVKSSTFGGEKTDITLLQGIGGAVASGGTHLSPGGCYDTTYFNHTHRAHAGRLLGGADWPRAKDWDNAGGGEHVHHNTIGGPHNPAGARQWPAYYAGKNGLRNNGPDTGPKIATRPLFVAPWTPRGARGVRYLTKSFTARAEGSTKTAPLGVLPKGAKFTVVAVVNTAGVLWGINKNGLHVAMSVLTKIAPAPTPPAKPAQARIGSLNFPDATKITMASESARIQRAVDQINKANLHVLAIQEGVGRRGVGIPSSLMSRLLSALGSDWGIIVPDGPKADANENYLLHRKAIGATVHPNVPIYGTLDGEPLSGRHVSLVTFDTPIGPITVGNTQLINNNRPGAEVQAGLAHQALKDAAAGGPGVLLGDFNTDGPLTKLVAAGMHNSRVVAKSSATRDAVTYTNQTKTQPSTNPYWLIDGIWVSPSFEVNGYKVMLDLDANGDFILPRVSDHSLVYVSLS